MHVLSAIRSRSGSAFDFGNTGRPGRDLRIVARGEFCRGAGTIEGIDGETGARVDLDGCNA